MTKWIIIFLPITLFAFLEATLLSAHLVLLAVLGWAALRPGKDAAVIAFSSGVILDLVRGENLGLSSLVFLILVFLLSLYQKKFNARNLFYLLPFALLSISIYGLVLRAPFSWGQLIWAGVLMIFLWPVLLISESRLEQDSQLALKF